MLWPYHAQPGESPHGIRALNESPTIRPATVSFGVETSWRRKRVPTSAPFGYTSNGEDNEIASRSRGEPFDIVLVACENQRF
jgi:hypothetical protein